ncbi:MAG: hypothetical protein WC455_15165 [Dehalococcoidia bacterium]|jgi:hypothetical protein
MKHFVLLAILAITLFSACATQQNVYDRVAARMNPLIGKATYDDIISQHGPPANKANGDAIFVAVWTTNDTKQVYAPVGQFLVQAPVSHGYEMRCTFDSQTQLLKGWKYREW